jgi:2'-5' RNA ligase
MRLFIAIDFDEIKDYLALLQETLKEADARMTFPESFHITLKFLGEVSDSKVEDIKEKLKRIKFKPFKAKTKELGVFPSENYIRVVWLGLEDGKHITKLQEQVESVLKGFRKDDNPFTPHITLARIKFIDDNNKESFVKLIKSIKLENKEVEIKNFKLVKSALTTKGPVYEDVAVFS